MPFVIVWGIPPGTPGDDLVQLRKDIVEVLSEEMMGWKVPQSWIRPFFPREMLGLPAEEGDEGSRTIYVQLDTGLFKQTPDVVMQKRAREVTQALATVIWMAFSGRFEVECFIGYLDPATKCLIQAM